MFLKIQVFTFLATAMAVGASFRAELRHCGVAGSMQVELKNGSTKVNVGKNNTLKVQSLSESSSKLAQNRLDELVGIWGPTPVDAIREGLVRDRIFKIVMLERWGSGRNLEAVIPLSRENFWPYEWCVALPPFSLIGATRLLSEPQLGHPLEDILLEGPDELGQWLAASQIREEVGARPTSQEALLGGIDISSLITEICDFLSGTGLLADNRHRELAGEGDILVPELSFFRVVLIGASDLCGETSDF